jgi:hypothetical protein
LAWPRWVRIAVIEASFSGGARATASCLLDTPSLTSA